MSFGMLSQDIFSQFSFLKIFWKIFANFVLSHSQATPQFLSPFFVQLLARFFRVKKTFKKALASALKQIANKKNKNCAKTAKNRHFLKIRTKKDKKKQIENKNNKKLIKK